MIEYTPWDDGGGGVRMGLTPIAAEHWLQQPHDYIARLQQRRMLAQNRRNEVFARLPGDQTDQALEEVAALINAAAGPAFASADRGGAQSAAPLRSDVSDDAPANTRSVRADTRFLSAGLGVCEDLCLLLPDGDDYRLHAALLCAPSFWFLRQKLGLPLAGIHAPVTALEQKIGARIRAFLRNMPPDRVFTRGNWHLHNTADLFHPHPDDWTKAHTLTAENIGQRLWLRCERQTLRKLAHCQAILFTILVYVNPLTELARRPELAQQLLRAYANMPPEERQARHFAEFGTQLQAWVQRL